MVGGDDCGAPGAIAGGEGVGCVQEEANILAGLPRIFYFLSKVLKITEVKNVFDL